MGYHNYSFLWFLLVLFVFTILEMKNLRDTDNNTLLLFKSILNPYLPYLVHFCDEEIMINFHWFRIALFFVHVILQDDDALQPILRNNPDVMKELRQWQLQQKSKSILLDGNFIAYVFELRKKYYCLFCHYVIVDTHCLCTAGLSELNSMLIDRIGNLCCQRLVGFLRKYRLQHGGFHGNPVIVNQAFQLPPTSKVTPKEHKWRSSLVYLTQSLLWPHAY